MSSQDKMLLLTRSEYCSNMRHKEQREKYRVKRGKFIGNIFERLELI